MRKFGLIQIPVLDNTRKVIDIIIKDEVFKKRNN